METTGLTRKAAALFAVLSFTLVAQGGAPTGWILAGNKPANYETGVDATMSHNGYPTAYLKSKPSVTSADEGFGTLMQTFRAEQYRGKRVRFRASVKTETVSQWSGLWMRIDKGSEVVGFDNMQSRPLKGTSDWQSFDVVLEVPNDATSISFGVLLTGTGAVWLSNASFETVADDVPLTSKPTADSLPKAPVNLDFRE
jgi:hypothetical protein